MTQATSIASQSGTHKGEDLVSAPSLASASLILERPAYGPFDAPSGPFWTFSPPRVEEDEEDEDFDDDYDDDEDEDEEWDEDEDEDYDDDEDEEDWDEDEEDEDIDEEDEEEDQ